MSAFGLKAQTIRNLLLSLLVIGMTGGVGVFIYAHDSLNKYATEVNHKVIDARASNSTIQLLQATQKTLQENQDVRKRISLLKSGDQFPEFRIVDEVKAIAKQNNITVKSFSYKDPTATTDSLGVPIPGVAGQAGADGEKTIGLLVDLESPIDYRAFLEFLYDIEQHLPKMKIGGVSLTPGNSPGKISVAQLNVEMYVK